jgi:hypothetical protein
VTESRVRRWRRSLRLLLVAVAGPTLAVGALTVSPAHAAAADDIRINEVVTTGSVNDSVELFRRVQQRHQHDHLLRSTITC